MARIRSIHPGLMSDEAFMTLTIEAPVAIPLLLGLWMEADDDGVFEWKPLTLKAKALPAASIDINSLLSVLVELNFIRKFDVEGKPYGAIRNFKLWQRPKLPKVKWPKGDGISAYVGENSPSITQSLPIDGETSPQREEEGGEEVGDDISLRSNQSEKEMRERKDFDDWFLSWPSAPSDNIDDALSAWSDLTDIERSEAKAKSAAYQEAAKGGGRTTICSAPKYLRQRLWTRIKAKPPEPPPKAVDVSAAASAKTREEYIAAEIERSKRSFQR